MWYLYKNAKKYFERLQYALKGLQNALKAYKMLQKALRPFAMIKYHKIASAHALVVCSIVMSIKNGVFYISGANRF